DLRGRQVRALVVRRDRRVVPRLDLAGEDLGDRLGRQLQAVHAGEVVDHGDRADDHRQVQRGVALAALPGGCGLLLVERRVRAGEGDLPAGERLDAGSRTARVVVEVGAGALGGVDLRPLLDGVLLCAGPGGVDAAGRAVDGAGGGTPRARRGVVVAS